MTKVHGAETGFKGKATISGPSNHFLLDHTEELGFDGRFINHTTTEPHNHTMEPRLLEHVYMGDFLNHHMTTAAQGATGLQVWVRVRIGFGLDTDRVWVLAPLLIVIQPNWSKEVSLTY